MKLINIIIIAASLLFLAGCGTTRQDGGSINFKSPFGTTRVEQPQNAKDSAHLDYNEEGLLIPHNPGDEFDIVITTLPNGKVVKEIKFKPTGKGEISLHSLNADSSTGTSYEDMAAQLDVFLKNAKVLLWVGIGFLVGGGLWIGFVKDFKTGFVLIGIGGLMLIGYAVMPQLYKHWVWLVLVGVAAIPIIWYTQYRKVSRIAKASVKAHEKLKAENPDVAKESTKVFKEHINPDDITEVKKLRDA